MIAPLDHPRENLRLSILRDTCLFTSNDEKDYEQFVAVASAIADTPIALISLIDTKRQWFKAKTGLNVSETPRNVSFCGHAVLLDHGELIVADARLDERFADNPLVTGEPHIRFYAGIPIRLGEQALPIGTLCVIDQQPRTLSPNKIAGLVALGKILEVFITNKLRARPSIKPEYQSPG